MAKTNEATKAKTPSVNYLAAAILLSQMDQSLPPADELTTTYGSRISEEKRAKVVEQIAKVSKKFKERLQKIVEKFHA